MTSGEAIHAEGELSPEVTIKSYLMVRLERQRSTFKPSRQGRNWQLVRMTYKLNCSLITAC